MKWKLILIIIGIGVLIVGGIFALNKMQVVNLLPESKLGIVSASSFNPLDTREIGYEFLDDDKVVHIWNTQDDYFFNKSSGIQFTNHFEDYWTRNVFCLGYYNGGEWNKINCADELTGFNRVIDTDNQTYINATLWKDITYGDYNMRLGVNYYLGLNDKNLSITIYGKNIGIDIPFELGFAWKITEWDIPPSESNDYIKVNNTNYVVNSFNDDIIFNEVDNTFIKGFDNRESLRVDWDENLNYAIKMFGDGIVENFYVALLINAGTFSAGQEKSTTFYWIDLIGVDDTSDGTVAGSASLTVEHITTGTATNGILIVTVQVTDASETDRIINNVTYNNVELTHLPADADDNIEQRTEIWYLTNPEETTANIVVTADGSCTDLSLGAISLTGVNTNLGGIDKYSEDNYVNLGLGLGTQFTAVSQSFTADGGILTKTRFYIRKTATPSGDIVSKIYEHTGTYGTSSLPTGGALATSEAIEASSLSISNELVQFSFSDENQITLTDGIKYVVTVEYSGDAGVLVNHDGDSPTHDGNYGRLFGTWSANSDNDAIFYVETGIVQTATGDSSTPNLSITTIGDSSYVIDSLAIAEADGSKIGVQHEVIHKTDVGGDTHASQYVDAGGAGVQVMNYSDTDQDKSWVMSAVAVQVLSADTASPLWFDNSTNSTVAGTFVKHNVRWTDAGLSGYFFSFDNGSGTFANDTWVSFTGTNNWSNVSKIANYTVGSTIQWQVYANDTASPSNWNLTDTFQYDTTSAQCWADITGGIYVPSGCTYYVPSGGAYIT